MMPQRWLQERLYMCSCMRRIDRPINPQERLELAKYGFKAVNEIVEGYENAFKILRTHHSVKNVPRPNSFGVFAGGPASCGQRCSNVHRFTVRNNAANIQVQQTRYILIQREETADPRILDHKQVGIAELVLQGLGNPIPIIGISVSQ